MALSARDGDTNYLLRQLPHTPYRFRVGIGASVHAAGLSELEALAVDFVRAHPGATIQDLRGGVLSLGGLDHVQMRDLLIGLVDKGVFELAGRVSLEEVDDVYEWVPNCDLCGASSNGNKVLLWKYNTPVVRCSNCGLVYANPRWKAEHLFGRYTPEYWEHYTDRTETEATDPTRDPRWYAYLTTLGKAHKNGRLLDVGCATGEFLVAAQAHNWDVYGVESSPMAAEIARRSTGGHIHAGTLDTADFPEGWFDAIAMLDVIEHLQSPRSYIEQSARLVRPGGLLTITTPNIHSLAFRLLGGEWTPIGPNDHLYYFAPRTMARLLNECGFNIFVMHTSATMPVVWEQWLRYPLLQRLAPMLKPISLPITNRFLLGDELYVVAQRVEG